MPERVRLTLKLLIFVKNDAVDHHAVALTGIFDVHRNADTDASLYRIFIEFFAALRHIDHFASKVIMTGAT